MTKAERTKQFIIEQAAPIYNEKGISGATIDEVLDAANVARGCLYNHFENKDALSFATVDFLLAKNDSVVSGYVLKGKTAVEKIHNYLQFNKTPLHTHISGGCPILNMAAESDDNNPVVKEKVKKNIVNGQKFFVDILQEGVESGELSDALDIEGFSFKLFSSVQGAIVMCRVLGSNKPMQSLIRNFKAELQVYQKDQAVA